MQIEIEDVMTEHRFIILVDIIGFSELTDEQQKNIIEAVNKITNEFIENGGYSKDKLFSSFVPTGDGFYIIGSSKNSIMFGQVMVIFEISLINKILDLIESSSLSCEGIKTAIHYGTTLPFTDILGNENYIGRGMNETARLISPINNDGIELIAEKIYGHQNSVIISQKALSKIEDSQLKVLKISEPFTILAKHDKNIQCCFVNTDKIYKLLSPGV